MLERERESRRSSQNIQHGPGLELHLLSPEHHPPPRENWNSRRPWAEQGADPGSEGVTVQPEMSPCTPGSRGVTSACHSAGMSPLGPPLPWPLCHPRIQTSP